MCFKTASCLSASCCRKQFIVIIVIFPKYKLQENLFFLLNKLKLGENDEWQSVQNISLYVNNVFDKILLYLLLQETISLKKVLTTILWFQQWNSKYIPVKNFLALSFLGNTKTTFFTNCYIFFKNKFKCRKIIRLILFMRHFTIIKQIFCVSPPPPPFFSMYYCWIIFSCISKLLYSFSSNK